MPKRVLLDENLPQKLRLLLGHHEAITTAYQGWAGISNGELLTVAEKAGFDVLVTADQGLNYQQNLKGRKLAVVVLSTNKNSLVIGNALRIAAAIDEVAPESFVYVEFGH
jgi:predicted nuclease of predicted toxin-antitoxin system